MKILLMMILLMTSTSIFAGDKICCSANGGSSETVDKITEHEEETNEYTQKVRVITKWKTKVVYKDRIVYRDRPAKVIYRDRIVYKDRPVVKYKKPKTKVVVKKKTYVKYPNKNSISLMAFAQRTKLKIDEDEKEYDVERVHEGDVGLMYQRDIGRSLRFSIGGNTDGTGFLGLGFNF
jgi:hypothetical protein